MRIHLMQHGQCLSEALDPHQPLSPVGREMTEKAANAARMLGLRFELIATSPKVRAMQTAEIMARATGYPVSRIEVSDVFKATAPAEGVIDFINEYDGLDSILVTGHLPSLAAVAARLLGAKGLSLSMVNTGLTQIEVNPAQDKGVLNWHLTPAQLSLIAGS
jgi:phosphohistidine phosphatase